MNGIITLGEFIIETQSDYPQAKGDFTKILSSIRLAAKVVNREVNKAGLADILGTEGEINVQGEIQQKLDVYANEQFIAALKGQQAVCGIATEENDTYITLDNLPHEDRKYVLLMDPLDGSSNIDVNVSVGTIFSIYRRVSRSANVMMEDFLQPGYRQIAAGYVIYGSSTMLVYTTGQGVHGFTLDPSIGVFCLSHPNMKMPETGPYYSINEGNYLHFPAGVKKYIKHCQEIDPSTHRPYSFRYIGSLVSDFHRNLIKGGIYIYPSTSGHSDGKLRLMYEANPLAYIAEQAGGKASDGYQRILDIQPHDLHQRVPLFIGSRLMVEEAESFMQRYGH